MFKNYYRYFSNMFCRPEIEAHFRNLLDKNKHVDVMNEDIDMTITQMGKI